MSTTGTERFQLGLFSANCSGGLAVTKIPERWSASWEDNLRLARIADEVGIDFVLPIARWIGYGGETNFHESGLEPIPWATAILATTTRLRAFATVHTAFNHPVVTAKQIATMDQVAPARRPQRGGGLEPARVRGDGFGVAHRPRRAIRDGPGVVRHRRRPLVA